MVADRQDQRAGAPREPVAARPAGQALAGRALAAVIAQIPGGVVRSEQAAMVDAVAAAVTAGEHLLVQAGTGTGKSLAYLCGVLPALTRRDGTRRPRVVISTATLALQRQLVEFDLPRLVAGLRADRPGDDVLRYAVLKGRSNYACLHRVRDGVPDDQGRLVPATAAAGPAGSLGAEVLGLREWAQRCAAGSEPVPAGGVRGDRDGAPEHRARAWQQVSVSARECLGQSCPYVAECFAELAREKAGASDIVVTNHALVAVDAVENVPLLPAYDVLVVDEAHELAARFTASASGELSVAAVERAARRAGAVVVDEDGAGTLAASALALSAALVHADPDVRLVPVRPPAGAGGRAPLDGPLVAAVAAVRDGARTALSGLPSGRSAAEADGVSAAVRVARAAVEEVFGLADRLAAGSGGDVVWVSERSAGPVPGRALAVAPLAVSGLIRDRLLGRATTVLTSATLMVGGEFGHLARSVGLRAGERVPAGPPASPTRAGPPPTPAPDSQPWRALDVGSPFDYRRQGILYSAARLPPPGRDGPGAAHLAEIVDLVSAAGGGALGLFSSRAAAVAAAAAVRAARPDLPVLCQDEGHLTQLIRTFVADPRASLFGTLSLWQGLDVPGDTCRLVVIDRIPFPRPDDPVLTARARAVTASGGNGFLTVSAAHAALLLAQGAGRLIRRDTDRGVVAILDSRLATARYGSYLRASLPPLWPTTDGAQVRAALRRLADRVPAAPGSTSAGSRAQQLVSPEQPIPVAAPARS